MKAIHKERLKKLEYMLRNHDKIFEKKLAFHINYWTANLIKKKKGCGTVACALGSAAQYPPFMKEGLGFDEYQYAPRFENIDSAILSGAAFFGISRDESAWLFTPEYYQKKNRSGHHVEVKAEKISAAIVAKRVAKLRKHYKTKRVPLDVSDLTTYACPK